MKINVQFNTKPILLVLKFIKNCPHKTKIESGRFLVEIGNNTAMLYLFCSGRAVFLNSVITPKFLSKKIEIAYRLIYDGSSKSS